MAAAAGVTLAVKNKKKPSDEEIVASMDPDLREEMRQRSGRMTYPQIFIGDHHVGGFDDLFALEQDGKLDALLAA